MAHNYVVSAQKPTAVSAVGTGRFTGPDHLNLLIAKVNRLEIFLVSPEGLKPVQEVPINGRIVDFRLFRPQGAAKDLLFLLTAKHHAAILEFVPGAEGGVGRLETRAHGNIADRVGRPSETGVLVDVSREHQLIALRLYEGVLKVLQFESNSRELKAFNIRFTDLNVIDLAFLEGAAEPTLAYIYQDSNGRHVRTVELGLAEKEFSPGPWLQDNVESEAAMLIALPAPYSGVVVVGQESLTFLNGREPYISTAPPLLSSSSILCFAPVDADGARFLFGDMSGRLFMLLLQLSPPDDAGEAGGSGDRLGLGKVESLRVELLGETSIPECITYLDNGYVFIGSRLGDSQLICLHAEPVSPDQPNNFIEVKESYVNLGPIVDMAVVDLERQGQGQLVTCSGAFKDGSLRIIRNGIGINELSSGELPGIKALFNLRHNSQHLDNLLVLSFVGYTKTLLVTGEEMEEIELGGFLGEEQTLWAGSLGPDLLLQVSGADARLVSVKTGLVSRWALDGRRINVAAANGATGQLVVAAGKELFYLQASDTEIRQEASLVLDFEVACLDMSPLGREPGRSELVAAGLWSEISVRLFALPDLRQLMVEPLGGEMIPRSVLMAQFDSQIYLLVALGDGGLFYYQMNGQTGALMEKKKVTLGTGPVGLRAFRSRGTLSVFACSDRPTVIYASNQKLVFSNVNLPLVAQLCPFNSAAYPDSLALADDAKLTIGTVDEIQKLHIRTVPLGETARRIAHQEKTQTFGVLCVRSELVSGSGEVSRRPSASLLAPATSSSAPANARSSVPDAPADPEEREISSLLILDQNTWEPLHAHSLGPFEAATSLLSACLGDDPNPYYVVGTAMVYPDESESKAGRLLVFHYVGEGQLSLVHEKELKGCPYSLATINGKLVAAVNSSVRLFEWLEKELRLETSYFNFTTALYLKTKGDFVLAGDLMRNMTVLAYHSLESSLEEIGRDNQPAWMTAVEILDDDTFLGAETNYNIFSSQKDSSAASDEDRLRLQEMGAFHLGQLVNVFRKGSLVMEQGSGAESSVALAGPGVLFGTCEGGLGLIVQTSEPMAAFLGELEGRMRKAVQPVGNIDHEAWRALESDKRTEPAHGFVDGDLVEELLDLPREALEELAKGLSLPPAPSPSAANAPAPPAPATPQDLVKIVEDLSRLH